MRVYKRKQIFERITVICHISEDKKWMDWIRDSGYRITEADFKKIGFREYDRSKIRFVGEREIKEK